MDRRTVLTALGTLLTGCVGVRDGAANDTPDGDGADGSAGVATTTRRGTGPPPAPLVHWTFEFDRPAESVRVVHDRGEPITAARTDRLELVHTTHPDHPIPTDVTLTPTRTPEVSRYTWESIGGDPYPITVGDDATVEGITPGDTVAVWWYGTEHHQTGVRMVAVTYDTVPA